MRIVNLQKPSALQVSAPSKGDVIDKINSSTIKSLKKNPSSIAIELSSEESKANELSSCVAHQSSADAGGLFGGYK